MRVLAYTRFLLAAGILGASALSCNQDDTAVDEEATLNRDVSLEEERVEDTAPPIVVVDPEDVVVDSTTPGDSTEREAPGVPSGIAPRGSDADRPLNVDEGGTAPKASGGDVVDVPDLNLEVQPDSVDVPEPETESSAHEGLPWPDLLRTRLASVATTIT